MRRPLLLAAFSAALAGCNIVAPIGYLAYGPEKTPAAHTLDKQRATVIVIDDPASVTSRRQLRAEMGERADSLLLSKAGLKEVIDSRAAMAVLTRDRASDPMTVEEIGRSLGADVVIWIAMDSFSLTPDGQAYAPSARMRAKVIDSTTGKRLWPTDKPAGHAFGVDIPTRAAQLPEGTTGIAAAERSLALRCGDAIAQLFYEHERLRSVQVKD